ncbi:MAG TPA: laccase domain-containing protein, partial [Beijerinckiaceae bacterium]|nr:laccase domain-containing protein [Beijerinckiaceae bacterium]
ERRRIVAVLGPTISARSYEVSAEFVANFIAAEAGNQRFFIPSARSGHAMFDLPGYIVMRLKRIGVGTAVNLDICTYLNEGRLFSYRRMTHRGEPDYGRQMSAIAIVP